MFYVYIIRNESHPAQICTGFTRDLKSRVVTHNMGGSSHTRKFIPWHLEIYCAFHGERKARDFEAYLKSNSGKAFANKRLL